MNQEPNFEVFWSNASYRVQPFVTLSDVCKNLGQSTQRCINFMFESHKRKSYDLNPVKKKGSVTILKNVSGSFRSGELTAVMGPSGAGKTSLLNLIARRTEKGYTGQLYIQGANRRLTISTIPQNDHLPQYLTVKENLLFASRLKNLAKDFDHEKVVAEAIKVLDLERCANLMTYKISGGQQKRVSIAQEFVSKPDILILDEPTSGLDSLTCHKALAVLKNLVKTSLDKPIAILLTIHQPEHNVFDMFDKIYALAPGGIAIYNGPPQKCAEFIQKHTGLKMPNPDYNPGTFLIEIASNEHGPQAVEVLRQQVRSESADWQKDKFLSDRKKESQNGLGRKLLVSLETDVFNIEKWAIDNTATELSIDKRLVIGSSISHGYYWSKTMILAYRYFVSLIRDPKQLFASFLVHFMLPFVMAAMIGEEPGRSNACPRFLGKFSLQDLAKNDDLVGEDTLGQLERSLENCSSIFITTYSILATSAGIATLSFALDMRSSLKEYHNGWYPINSYMLARIITDLPFSTILPFMCMTLTFFLTGQESGGSLSMTERTMIASVSTVLGAIAGKLLGMIFGAIFMGQVITALFVSQASFMPFIMISGFLVRPKNMKPIVRILSELSFMKHNIELNILARYGFDICECNSDSLKKVEITGVSEQLMRVTKYYMEEMDEEEDESSMITANTTTNSSLDEKGDDLFQLFAEQVQLFNSFGRKIENCKHVQPHQLYELSLNDEDLVPIMAKYSLLVLGILLLLLATVKLVVRSKTSL